MNRSDDAARVSDLLRGDASTTDAFVREHAGWMLALCRRMRKDDAGDGLEEVPEDLVQAVIAARQA